MQTGQRPRQNARFAMPGRSDATRGRPVRTAAFIVAALLAMPAAGAAERPALALGDQPVSRSYPHAPRIEQVVEVDGFARYAFEATGEQLVRVQLVDRLAGPGPIRFHRTDRFLDRGDAKVVLHGQDEGTGDIELTARPFRELNGEDLPRLPAHRLVETELRDYQRRSYWIEVDEPRTLNVEAGGRYLADLRLWRDGRWLVAAEPTAEVREPVTGQPLEVRRIHTRLTPGLYRLTAYGGPGNPWSTASDDAPLYLRAGIPELPAEGWSVMHASPFGVDRYRVRTPANVFRLALPEARPASLRVSPYSESRSPYQARGGRSGRIDKDARDPETTVRTGNAGPGRLRDMLITVERAPGGEYRLAYLHHARRYAIPGDAGSAWVSTVALGDPQDAIDATAVIVHDPPGGRPVVKASRAIELSSGKVWHRRFNLLDTVDLLVEVQEDGTYVAEVGTDSEAKVELQIEPLDRSAARNFRTRWDVASEARWDLVEGFYRISMRPRHGDAGIADVSLHHTATPPDSLGAPESAPRQASAIFDGIALSRYDHVLTNRYNQGRSGLTVRPWPLALNTPLPVTQSASTSRRFRVSSDRPRTLIAETPAGKRLALAITPDGAGSESLTVDGEAHVHVTNDSPEPLLYLLRWAPEPTSPPPLEVVGAGEARRRLPDFPVIEPGKTERLNLSRRQQATYELAVETPALYRLETTGLLATAGRLRTRTVTELAAAEENGIGRNFLIQRYLGRGDYRLSVAANGRSAGPLGVTLERTPVREAGQLPLDGTARTSVAPGEAVRYRLDVPETGRYRISASGLEQPFAIQLTGPDGWPVIHPGRRTPLTLRLRPGPHTLTVLPQSVAARAVTSVERIDESPAPLSGHGPHDLTLNQTRHHTWMEPDDESAPRTPDQWHFSLAAAMHVRLDLPAGMDAALKHREQGRWQSADADIAAARKDWLALDAGDYRLEVRSRRPDNRLDYHVRIATRELPLGQRRRIAVPGSVSFVLDTPRLVKIGSLGGQDVAAALRDASGERLTFNDDRPDDWNFLISRHLPAGRYELAVTAPGSDGHTTVSLNAPDEVTENAKAPDSELDITDGDVHIYPLDLPTTEAVPAPGLPLVFASRSAGTHGVALERWDGTAWRTITTHTGKKLHGGTVLTADDLGQDHRLRIWALDTVPGGIRVTLRLGRQPVAQRELTAARPWQLTPLEGTGSNLRLAMLARPGPLHTLTPGDELLWATPGRAFQPVHEGWIPARDRAVWVMAPSGLSTLDAEVVSLAPGSTRTIPVDARDPLPLRVQGDDTRRLRLWMATSTAHLPELRPRTPQAGIAATPGRRSAVAIALPGNRLDDGGLALRLVDAAGEAPVTVSAHALTAKEPVVAAAGSTQIHLPAGTAVAVTGPDGAAEIALTAPARVAGALATGDTVRQILWTGGHARKMHTRSAADMLWLANPGDRAETVSLDWRPIERFRNLVPGRFAAYEPTFNGTLAVPVNVPAGFKGRVHVAGAVTEAQFVADDGGSPPPREGTGSVTITGPGVLHVTHVDAPFGIWLAGSDGSLSGWRHTETLPLESPRLLSLRGGRPTLIALNRPAGGTEHRWLDVENGIDAVLPAGDTRVRTMGEAPAMQLTEATAMPAGLGEAVRLGPGESRAFVFELQQARTVGLGVKADREVIRAVLVDEHGQRIGEGIAQMHRLEPGRYYLIAHLPRDQAPALVRPALVGTRLPDDGPPERVRERYRQLAGKE